MQNTKIRKISTLILEPVAFGLLALLFIIPSITVINLEPITKKIKEFDVLGISSQSELSVNIIGGSHQIFDRENLDDTDQEYIYTTLLTRRNADRYSKPILEIINKKQEEMILEIYGNTTLPTGSNISLIIDDQVYKLQTPDGDIHTQKIKVIPNKKYVLFLAVENFSDVQFEEDFELHIKEIEY